MNLAQKPEVLSPAGSFDMLEAAVRSGADAVYFGAKEFSARRNAQNFSSEEIKTAVEYCHIRNVKVYLTLNIMLKDEELPRAVEIAADAYNSGIDGIIIQDLGLARILRRQYPDLKLHASTQMSVHTKSALPILKNMGFCQVVAAREMSFDSLKELCEEAYKLQMTVEVFVHGALCMSVSGQCLLSSFFGSRSGNRGLCAGPCRLPFSVQGGTGYDLSLKDLSLLEELGKLYDIGVRSFKIEGRMKRPEYVAAATAACRQAVDKGIIDSSLQDTLRNVFSRSGFTKGYLENKLGINMFGIRTKEDVVSANAAFPGIHELYRSERSSVEVTAQAEISSNKEITLTLSDGHNTVTVTGDVPQLAKNRAADQESILKNLNKFGSTPYCLTNADINIDDGLFVSAGEINDLRRRACEFLDYKRSAVPHKPVSTEYIEDICDSEHLKSPKLIARFENPNSIPDNLSGVDMLALTLEADPTSLKDIRLPLMVDIPRGIVSEKAVAERLKLFKANGFEIALCGNLAAIEIAKKQGFKVFCDTGMNVYNSESASAVSEMGAEAVMLSSEGLVSDLVKLKSPIKTGIVGYGNVPLMLFKNCPLKNGRTCEKCDHNGHITDRMNIEFPVRCRMGYSELLNSVPTWMADRMDELSGLDYVMLYFTREDKARSAVVLNSYKHTLPPDVKHTRGLFYRGTI